jgi:hypothetical protein
MEKRREIRHRAGAEGKGGHSLLRAAGPEKFPEQIALDVIQDYRGTDQVRTAAAAGILAMAKPARGREKLFAPRRGGGILLASADGGGAGFLSGQGESG